MSFGRLCMLTIANTARMENLIKHSVGIYQFQGPENGNGDTTTPTNRIPSWMRWQKCY